MSESLDESVRSIYIITIKESSLSSHKGYSGRSPYIDDVIEDFELEAIQ